VFINWVWARAWAGWSKCNANEQTAMQSLGRHSRQYVGRQAGGFASAQVSSDPRVRPPSRALAGVHDPAAQPSDVTASRTPRPARQHRPARPSDDDQAERHVQTAPTVPTAQPVPSSGVGAGPRLRRQSPCAGSTLVPGTHVHGGAPLPTLQALQLPSCPAAHLSIPARCYCCRCMILRAVTAAFPSPSAARHVSRAPGP
jgi:hypothetical protein